MVQIVSASAFANNEVAFIAWTCNINPIPDCLGFEVVREYLHANDTVTSERTLAAYVAFEGQHNSNWQAQDTSVWPVQKFDWRDLTLRRKRDASGVRPEGDRVRYRIRAVGKMADGLTPVPEHFVPLETAAHAAAPYTGDPIPLGYLSAPAYTNAVVATRKRGPFISTFTNGILSTQFLAHAMDAQGANAAPLKQQLLDPTNPFRLILAGDVPTTISDFFATPGGTIYAALYELDDPQLIGLLKTHADRVRLILSDAGGDAKTKVYDTTNAPVRADMHAIAAQPGATFTIQDRMFNGSGHIGHNKFLVWADDGGVPRRVLTGSTNWTWTGLCGQSNNCIITEDDAVAKAYHDYWQRLQDDPLPVPSPISAPNSGANQSDALKSANRTPVDADFGSGATGRVWFSPNMPGKAQPPSDKAAAQPVPPDIDELFGLMRRAQHMILFAVFLPSRAGKHSIIEQAVNLGLNDTTLRVLGAISDSTAIWGYQAGNKADGTAAISPYLFDQNGVSLVRAAALDKKLGKVTLGDFVNRELLTLGKAIIHDKIVVIDPMDPVNCVVAFGSHNMGYKASYSNDENLLIVKGHADLAQAYAVHVLDVYDHYRFRAVSQQQVAAAQTDGSASMAHPEWDGFLKPDDSWQAHADHSVADYFTGHPTP